MTAIETLDPSRHQQHSVNLTQNAGFEPASNT